MNVTSNKHESMTAETSRKQSFYDITSKYDRKNKIISLDFRQLPAIKIDAIARLTFPDSPIIHYDLWNAMMYFEEFLSKRYGNFDSEFSLHYVHYDRSYSISLQNGDWHSQREPAALISDLKKFLSNEVGISLESFR